MPILSWLLSVRTSPPKSKYSENTVACRQNSNLAQSAVLLTGTVEIAGQAVPSGCSSGKGGSLYYINVELKPHMVAMPRILHY